MITLCVEIKEEDGQVSWRAYKTGLPTQQEELAAKRFSLIFGKVMEDYRKSMAETKKKPKRSRK